MFSLVPGVLFLCCILPCHICNGQGSSTYNVMDFGATPDGTTDSTRPFSRAWALACGDKNMSTIYVPQGLYLIKAVEFRGPCRNTTTVRINGTLVAPDDFRDMGNSSYWILFIKVDRLSILGGVLDAKGAGFWACRISGQNCTVGARSITLNWVNDAQLKGLTSINSQLTHVVINSCNNVNVSDLSITAPDLSPNTDGIHVQTSTNVTITNTNITTGDDCISIGPGSWNLWIDQIRCGPGHGLSIGSLGREFEEAGVQNITVTNSEFNGSDNGLRIKTWARPSTGFVRNITYQNIIMQNVDNPIIIDQNYCPNNDGCPGQSSGIKIEQVTYENIQGTSATPVAMIFDCSPTNPCAAIRLQDIKLTYLNTTKAQSSCNNIGGTVFGVILPENCL
ncbi:polygalacturonase-like [Henckelia pumila]|uniref:polygalacturonase-like n=1 Tax=Henckelia pumila TaxID=405737 RepID=UPI003C6DB829